MSEDGVLSFAIVAEADADRRTACELADRVLCDQIEWLEPDVLEGVRRWQGKDTYESYLKLASVPDETRSRDLKAHGKFAGEDGAGEARQAWQALLVLHAVSPPPVAVFLIRDTDNRTERRNGFQRAREEWREKEVIVLGLAHPKRECWILAGFEPQDEDEHVRLNAMRKELGFAPCSGAEGLTALHEHDKKNAKRVLKDLCGSDPTRERTCWTRSPLETLSDRGKHTGLGDYLGEVRDRVVPLCHAPPA